jgi:hypothetical protein
MASSLERTSSSGSVPIQCNEGNIQVLLPDANTPAWEEVFTGVKEGTIRWLTCGEPSEGRRQRHQRKVIAAFLMHRHH